MNANFSKKVTLKQDSKLLKPYIKSSKTISYKPPSFPNRNPTSISLMVRSALKTAIYVIFFYQHRLQKRCQFQIISYSNDLLEKDNDFHLASDLAIALNRVKTFCFIWLPASLLVWKHTSSYLISSISGFNYNGTQRFKNIAVHKADEPFTRQNEEEGNDVLTRNQTSKIVIIMSPLLIL